MKNVNSATKRDFTNGSLTDLHPKASRARAYGRRRGVYTVRVAPCGQRHAPIVRQRSRMAVTAIPLLLAYCRDARQKSS